MDSKFLDPSERFLRFAAECEVMAKFTRSPENKTVWNRMAERWVRCARLYERADSAAQSASAARRHRTAGHTSAH
ncbi:MAG TPA: hypothetical protein VKW08_00935 [Xanthobacteraceae bacterium]|nr:hypothetical protein [Xanthobacteraceae bacterium]